MTGIGRYRDKLRDLYEHRCGYCKRAEEELGGSGEFFQVDQFRPKSLFPELADDLDNLVYCCATCNRMKGASWPSDSDGSLLHPLKDDWAAHMRQACSGMLEPVTDSGARTIQILGLNRPPLVYSRRAKGTEGEVLYEARGPSERADETVGHLVVDINQEILRFLATHPEKLYDLTPRRFEELIAAILEDLGLEVELTQATRDGGVDIYAFVRHEVASFLMVVECKRWAPNKAVGIEVVQRLYGVQQSKAASKSLIVTTSFFSSPAREQCREYRDLMELRDFEDLKVWLNRYK